MAVKTEGLESERIESVCGRVRERMAADEAAPFEAFVRQYYHWVPPEDLANRSTAELCGTALAHWELAQHREQDEVKVRVFNPTEDEDGYRSPFTVVDIVSEDVPFVVDSVTMELNRQGYSINLVIHPVMGIRRDEDGQLLEVLEPNRGVSNESILHAEVTHEDDAEERKRLRTEIERVLGDVMAAVHDWGAMRAQTEKLVRELESDPPPIDQAEIEEGEELLRWLADDHFTFLGYREYELTEKDGDMGLAVVEGSGLGILRKEAKRPFTKLEPKALELARSPQLLVVTKANSRATVHRPAYLDYIGVKRYKDGEVVGERRFLGLFTHYAYRESPLEIPMLRGKVKRVLDQARFTPHSYDDKALMEILEAYPRDSLFQIETDKLFEIAMGILGLGERQRLRLFVREDPLDRFVACLVCLPRDRFNTQNRERIGRILCEEYRGTHVDWALHLSESVIVRIHYIVHFPQGIPERHDVSEIEQRLVRAVRAWTDDLRVELIEQLGAERAQSVYRRYESAFPPGYRDGHTARVAVADIAKLEELRRRGGPIIHLYRATDEDGADPEAVRCKLFSTSDVALSDVLPIFEHMGAEVVDEHPHEISPRESEPMWLYDFGLRVHADDVERIRDLFQETFLWVWQGEIENDGLNGLVLAASLPGRRVSVLRAIARYLRQASIPYSDAYMVRSLLRHPDVAAMLVELFRARFDPDEHDEQAAESLQKQIEQAIDAVESLDEDRILRGFLSVTMAILRTNFFRPGRTTLSFKVDPTRIPLLPPPRPRFEIFVFSPRVEGVHLRGGKVARGGIRWSDRPEDFRTEILGLMKAQMVKNALIVPVGSKGGFVVKRPPVEGGREALQEEAIQCYKRFLGGLLDLTDNIVDGKVRPPEHVVRYDEDDPYLVVAADKGTASFSDIANGVSAAYDFWLGDAFASGGSRGYDHKVMGITARGAWESVKRHFRELGVDIRSTDFTAVGIGDMSGDVFGNGMLLSRHTKLLAAFNHAHIFLDPDPDPEASFDERERLFKLERSTWSDYSDQVISEGGGVYLRSAKSIGISDQVKASLAIEDDSLSPAELIQAILLAPVDLLFNGGIGTYVKAARESHEDVGDKANDALRVDGRELRCRVVGEGGNLGFTQLGRVEYASSGGPESEGGRINTDAIDNVAGVNLSDHEVNIKILLGQLVSSGDLSRKERNDLLAEMTDAVAETVLYGNYTQTQALSLSLVQAAAMVDVHARLVHHLEQVAGLDRELEFLPTDDEIAERKAAHEGFLSPELAVIMAYCKIHLYSELVESDLPDDPYLGHDLERYFPSRLPEHYSEQMRDHRLRREIIATVVANQLVDRAGTTFAFRVEEEVGASAALLARGYAVAREVFDMRSFWARIEGLDNEVDAHVQLEMLLDGRRLVERATRWLVRGHPRTIEIEETTRRFQDGARLLERSLPDLLDDNDRETFNSRVAHFEEAGVPHELAVRVGGMPALRSVLDIVEVSEATGRSLEAVMETYFALGSKFVLTWLRDRIIELPRANRWQVLARAALRDDLYSLHRALSQEVLEGAEAGAGAEEAIGAWRERNESAVERVAGILADIRSSRTYDMTTLPVALRELRNLVRAPASDA